MTEAVVTIKGRNDLSYAVKQAERDLKGLLKQGELFGKVFRGGAIVGAVLAFERLAQNAELAAKKIGDEGTAKALRQLNREIDNLKSKGLNLIGKVLGDAYISLRGSDLDKLTQQARNLRTEIELLRQSRRGDTSTLGPGFFEKEKQLESLEAQIALRRTSRPFGERTRAPGSRGGGQSVVLTEPPKTVNTKIDPMAGLYDPNIYARPIFNLANEQEKALDELNRSVTENVRRNLQDLSNETGTMLGHMSEQWAQATSQWTAFAEQAAANITDAFAEFLFDPFEEGLQGMVAGFVDAIRQMLAQYLALSAITGLGSLLSNSSNSFISGIGGFLKGARAAGGPVAAGAAYLVGERGPELFVPRSSGMVVANGAGGVALTYHIDARGADAERIFAILPPLLRQSEERTVARLIDLQRRGRFA